TFPRLGPRSRAGLDVPLVHPADVSVLATDAPPRTATREEVEPMAEDVLGHLGRGDVGPGVDRHDRGPAESVDPVAQRGVRQTHSLSEGASVRGVRLRARLDVSGCARDGRFTDERDSVAPS